MPGLGSQPCPKPTSLKEQRAQKRLEDQRKLSYWCNAIWERDGFGAEAIAKLGKQR